MPTYLYAIGNMSGPVKIGISNSPERRLASFQTACPFPISVLKAVPCESRDAAFADEAFAHKHLDDRRIYGEWFDIEGREAMDIVTATVMSGIAFRQREDGARP